MESTKIECACRACGRVFFVTPAERARGKGQHCSRDCRVRPIGERFWSKVEKLDGDACWLWRGGLTTQGYGRFTDEVGHFEPAHRAAYRLTYGAAPADLYVCHHCDNPRCVRPDHLFLGTATDNARDRDAKGRADHPTGDRNASRKYPERRPKGAWHSSAKLTDAQVIDIRRRAANGERQRDLAATFGIGQSQVHRIVSGRGWRHLV